MRIHTPDWVRDAVFYQIFPDRFAHRHAAFGVNGYPAKPARLQPWGARPTPHGFQGGDLLGIIDRLDYLADLGVNALYLNPIFASASNHRYHTHDYYQVDPLLGGQLAFRQLLDAAHARQMRVVLDGVFNHASRGFLQFNHLLECGPESPYADWFHVHKWPLHAYGPAGAPLNYDGWWGNAALPEFNTDTPAVREFLWQVATYWIEQGIDGWRLDVPNEIDDDTFWQEFRRRVKQRNPDAYIVGELWQEGQRWLQGDQFDGQMNYLFTRAAFGYFLGERLNQAESQETGYGVIAPLDGPAFAAELERLHNELYDPAIVFAQLNMLGSHDTPRLMTMADGDETAVSLLFLCQMTIAGAPNIYYGDEIGLAGGKDPDCRRAFPWHDRSLWRTGLHAQVRQYVRLRQDLPALRRGDFTVLLAKGPVILFRRRYQDQTVVVAFNAGSTARRVRCPAELDAVLPERLASAGAPAPAGGSAPAGRALRAGDRVTLPPRSGRIWHT